MPSLKTCLTVGGALLAALPVNAGRMFDLTRAHAARKQAPVHVDKPLPVEEFRFMSDATAKYRVESLPDVHHNLGELYSGNIPIDEKEPDRTLFFMWQPKLGKPVDEIVIWLNGGPGCSSLEGFFQENGRFVWPPGTYKPVVNQFSWVNLTNMLWVEQPVGTGFATGQIRAKNERDIAKDFVGFFKNFQKKFGIKNYKIYVTGESYAGRYVPYISAEMLDQKDKKYFDLSGAITFDPVIGDFQYTQSQVTAVPLVKKNANLFNFPPGLMKVLDKKDEKCGYKALREKYLKFPPPGNQPMKNFNASADPQCDVFDLIYENALIINPCFDIYEINSMCPILDDVLSFPTTLDQVTYPTYFNRKDVKKAIHAPLNVDWHVCSNEQVFHGGPKVNGRYAGGPQEEGDLSPDPIQNVLPQVIEATNRVLVSNGDYDMIIITDGTLMSIQNMTWHGKLGFQKKPTKKLNVPLPDLQYAQLYDQNGLGVLNNYSQGIMGIQHYERGLMWVETFQSGHMQPEYQSRASYRYLEWLLKRIDHL